MAVARKGLAMTTRLALREQLRRVLEDTDVVSPLWSDAELGDYLATAVRQYSLVLPKRQVVTVAFTVLGASYALPIETLAVEQVSFPGGNGQVIPPRALPASDAGAAQSWYFDGANLLLAEGAGQVATAEVWCRAAYSWPVTDGTDVGLPPQGDECVVWGAAVLALTRRTISSGKRRQGQRAEMDALEAAQRNHREVMRRARGVVSRVLVVVE